MHINHENASGENAPHGLVLTVTATDVPKFVGLLNAGFMLNIRVGESVQTDEVERIEVSRHRNIGLMMGVKENVVVDDCPCRASSAIGRIAVLVRRGLIGQVEFLDRGVDIKRSTESADYTRFVQRPLCGGTRLADLTDAR